MTTTVPPATGTYLDWIIANTSAELDLRKQRRSISDLERELHGLPAPIEMETALRGTGVAIVAEVKRASPSKGPIAPGAVAEVVAGQYLAGGAAAISVLTDEKFFLGSLDDLRSVSSIAHLKAHQRPVLRKDFVIDPYQIVEARAAGADAILLIVAALDGVQLAELHAAALSMGLSVLVEVHDEGELERAIAIGATLVGVNNRDLRSFVVSLETTERLAPRIPRGVTLVSESGLSNRADIERVGRAGAHAVLVGEALMRSNDRVDALRILIE